MFQILIFMLKCGMKDIVYLVFLWCFFGFVHSIMISHFFKEILIKFTGKAFETYFYRIIYNLISLVIYLNIVYVVKNSTETFLLPPPLIYIFAIISLTGFLIAVIAFFYTHLLPFGSPPAISPSSFSLTLLSQFPLHQTDYSHPHTLHQFQVLLGFHPMA